MFEMMDSLFALFCFVQLLTVKSIVIDTKLGQIEGIKDDFGTYVFRNIPYATPPTGSLRWRPTQPLKDYKFNGIYNGTAPGNACVQSMMAGKMMIIGSNEILSEDCLTLGVQTPYQFDKPQTQSLRKVLLFIHTGGLQMGTGYGLVLSSLSKNQDIVVVGINYRLGVAAWLVDPALHDNPYGNGGANGFLDMIQALKWTVNNIESYGGDPNEITIAGESGGGWATCGLVLSPLAKGLFKRSIQMSGSCIESMGKFYSQPEAWEIAKSVRDSVNATSFDELREMDMQHIIDAFTPAMNMIPAIDGYVFPLNTLELVKNGYANGESTMIGTVFRESFTEKPFNMGQNPQNLTELNEYYYKKLYDTEAQLIQKYYPQNEINTKIWPYGESDFNDAILISTVQQTDCWVKCGSLWQADMMATHPILKDSFDVYFYQYGYIKQPYDQVSHAYDMIGLFGFDIEWINGGVEFSEEFVQLTQKFFGDYINGGVVPIKDGKVVSMQNGYYVQVVEDVKIVGIDDLDHIRDRCEVYKLFSDNIWREPFCSGTYPLDHEEMVKLMEQMNNGTVNANGTVTDQCDDGVCDKQEV